MKNITSKFWTMITLLFVQLIVSLTSWGSIPVGDSLIVISRISAANQAVMKVYHTNDSTYDIYVYHQSADSTTQVSAYFPDNNVTQHETNIEVTMNANTTYTFFPADNPTEPIDCSSENGGPVYYTCPCCTGNGNTCKVDGKVDERTGTAVIFCDKDTCTPPTDGTVTCELKQSNKPNNFPGGVLIAVAQEHVNVHLNY